MSDKPNKGTQITVNVSRRREVEKRTERSLLEVLQQTPPVTIDARTVSMLLSGTIDLGTLAGLSKPEQKSIAEIAHAYLSMGKRSEAQILFKALIALDPLDAYYHTALGSIAQQAGDWLAAEEAYSAALERHPSSAVALAHRGETRMSMGRLTEGIADLRSAMDADRSMKYPSTRRALATLRLMKEGLESEKAQLTQNTATPLRTKRRPQPRRR